MWHSLLLGTWKDLFFWLPIEELIQARQKEYSDALGKADQTADSAGFVELMLEIIRDTLMEISEVGALAALTDRSTSPADKLCYVLGNKELAAAELMKLLGLSHMPTFRKNYLLPALGQGLIEMTIPEKPNSRNQKYRRK